MSQFTERAGVPCWRWSQPSGMNTVLFRMPGGTHAKAPARGIAGMSRPLLEQRLDLGVVRPHQRRAHPARRAALHPLHRQPAHARALQHLAVPEAGGILVLVAQHVVEAESLAELDPE